MPRPLTETFPYRVEHPGVVREFAGLELGVDQVAVQRDLEGSAARWHEGHFLDLLLELGQQLARQTDGLRLVVSHRTVDQPHIHVASPFM